MNAYDNIYYWLKNNCQPLQNLWVVSSLVGDQKNIIQPKTAANMYDVSYERYADGTRKYIFEPTEPYYFDVDIICYRAHYADEDTYNLDVLDDVQSVCDRLIELQNEGSVPHFDKDECLQIECLTPRPFIQNQFVSDNNPNTILVDYAVTIRFYTSNSARRRVVVI